MKTYEVEIKRVSYIVTTVEAEDEQQARDEAIRWYEGSFYTDEFSAEVEYVRELADENV